MAGFDGRIPLKALTITWNHPKFMSEPRLSLFSVSLVLGQPIRWRMLAELADGEPRSNQEFTKQFATSASTIGKHLTLMRELGILEKRHGVHYLAARYRPAPGSREIDFGACVIRLDDPKWLRG
jgi:DNA-binding transcriptional ArsR family regulator